MDGLWSNTKIFFTVVGIGIVFFIIIILKVFNSFIHKDSLENTPVVNLPASDGTLMEGMLGRAYTDLRPAGVGLFNDKRIDVTTDGKLAKKDSTIRIVAIKGDRVIVEEII